MELLIHHHPTLLEDHILTSCLRSLNRGLRDLIECKVETDLQVKFPYYHQLLDQAPKRVVNPYPLYCQLKRAGKLELNPRSLSSEPVCPLSKKQLREILLPFILLLVTQHELNLNWRLHLLEIIPLGLLYHVVKVTKSHRDDEIVILIKRKAWRALRLSLREREKKVKYRPSTSLLEMMVKKKCHWGLLWLLKLKSQPTDSSLFCTVRKGLVKFLITLLNAGGRVDERHLDALLECLIRGEGWASYSRRRENDQAPKILTLLLEAGVVPLQRQLGYFVQLGERSLIRIILENRHPALYLEPMPLLASLATGDFISFLVLLEKGFLPSQEVYEYLLGRYLGRVELETFLRKMLETGQLPHSGLVSQIIRSRPEVYLQILEFIRVDDCQLQTAIDCGTEEVLDAVLARLKPTTDHLEQIPSYREGLKERLRMVE